MPSEVVGYCVKHKGKVAMEGPTLHRMEGRGRLGYAAKGKCPKDQTGMFKIMSESDYAKLKAEGLKEGATIKKKSKSRSGGRASTSGGRKRRQKRSRSRSKGRK
jgi:hypothetical protein